MRTAEDEEVWLNSELHRLGTEAENQISILRTLGAEGTKSQASELSKSLDSILKSIRRLHRDFELLAEEQETKEAALRVAKQVGHHKLQYENIKKSQERAFEEIKKNSERAWRKKKQELLAGANPRAQIADEKSALAASEGMTESLRRTREMMTEQISQTEGTTQLIGTSTQSLNKTQRKLKSQKELFGTSRRLLSSMSWQDVLDKIVLYGGVGFFLVVVLYILQKRMLGLTPQIVKDSVSNLVMKSVESGTEFYHRFTEQKQIIDPVKPPETKFDDLEPVPSEELIKSELQESKQIEDPVETDTQEQVPKDDMKTTEVQEQAYKDYSIMNEVPDDQVPIEDSVKTETPEQVSKEDQTKDDSLDQAPKDDLEKAKLQEEVPKNDMITTTEPQQQPVSSDEIIKAKLEEQSRKDDVTSTQSGQEVVPGDEKKDTKPQTMAPDNDIIKSKPQDSVQVSDNAQKGKSEDSEEDPYLDEEDSVESPPAAATSVYNDDLYDDKSILQQQQQEEEDEYEDVHLDNKEDLKDTLILPSKHDEL
eukprot:g3430.t1